MSSHDHYNLLEDYELIASELPEPVHSTAKVQAPVVVLGMALEPRFPSSNPSLALVNFKLWGILGTHR